MCGGKGDVGLILAMLLSSVQNSSMSESGVELILVCALV